MKVSISPLAAAEIDGIEAFVAEDNAVAARRLSDDLVKRCIALGEAPARGVVVGKIRGQDVRRLVHGQYLILYSIVGDLVRIHRVVHGVRSPRTLLKGLDPF